MSRLFFIFWKCLFFGLLGESGGGLKGQKSAQNEKEQLRLSCAISQEQYSI